MIVDCSRNLSCLTRKGNPMKLQMMTHGQSNTNHGRVSPYGLPQRTSFQNDTMISNSSIYQHIRNFEGTIPVDFRQAGAKLEEHHAPQYFDLNNVNLIGQKLDKNKYDAMSEDLLLVEEHIRPFIKEELRYSIQNKRLARGLPGTVEIEYKKPQPEDISPETMIKRERRRERNKVAAAKCRFKKKIVSEKLQEESEHLENLNLKLKREIQRLQEERQKLVYILNIHRPSCIVHNLNEDDQPTENNQSIKSSQKSDEPTTTAVRDPQQIEAQYALNAQPGQTWQETTLPTKNCYVDNLITYSTSEISSSLIAATQS